MASAVEVPRKVASFSTVSLSEVRCAWRDGSSDLRRASFARCEEYAAVESETAMSESAIGSVKIWTSVEAILRKS